MACVYKCSFHFYPINNKEGIIRLNILTGFQWGSWSHLDVCTDFSIANAYLKWGLRVFKLSVMSQVFNVWSRSVSLHGISRDAVCCSQYQKICWAANSVLWFSGLSHLSMLLFSTCWKWTLQSVLFWTEISRDKSHVWTDFTAQPQVFPLLSWPRIPCNSLSRR